jgi:Flp pilus assembly protein TadG
MTRSTFSNTIQLFVRNDRGTSAIEFALTAPFMLAMLLFTIAANDSVNASTEVGKVSVAVADIISQSPAVTREVIDSTFGAVDLMVNSTRKAKLELYVVGVEVYADGSTEVLWSRDNGNLSTLTKPGPGDNYKLPPEILTRSGFIVSARARLSHTNVVTSSGIRAGRQEKIGNVSTIGSLLPGMGDSTYYDYESNFVPRTSIRTSCDNCSN